VKRTPKTRPPILEGPFDLAVVGGGINGAAIARDAALRGKTVILLEKDDFAAGTSSRSSKMLHGGIRYLEQLRLGLVYQALRERYHILRVAPHLARPQAFVIPMYQGAKRGPRMIRVGLFLYDFLALGKRLGKSRFLRAEEVLARVPHLLKQGLVGGGVYHDAVMDDARLCLLNAVAAYEEGQGEVGLVTVRNYAPVVEVRPGSPATVLVHDRLTGQNASVLAHRVVRALGPWTDPELLVRSKGVHLVLPAFPMSDGILLTHSKDGRVFFLIPWLQKTIVGTTETPFSGSLERLRVEPEEVKYLLDEVQRLFPEVHIGARHILGTCAGVRPLARSHGLFASKAPGSVSRAHRIVDDGNGVLSVFGGKFTTYRLVAKEVVDKLFPGSPCETHRRALPGGEGGPWGSFQQRLGPETSQLGSTELERLFYRYGTRLHELLRLIQEDPSLGERLAPPYPELRAEVVYSAQQEFAFYPEDFLARRTTLRYSDDGGRAAYDAVESLLRAHAPAVPPDLDEAREKYCAELDWEERLRGK
jgi:glycerol-3-phosphate dehydrogenase